VHAAPFVIQVIQVAVTVYVAFVGLLLGSFINLAVDRVPRGESVIRPRSHCRACGRQLNVVDLIPVAGYLLRRGRCATCGAEIGLSSPMVEALCGSIPLASVVWLGVWPGSVVGVGLVAVLGLGLVALAVRPGSRSGKASIPAPRAR